MCWDKTANLKRKLDNVEREKMTDGGGDFRKVWAVSRVGLGWGGSQAASAGRHTVCRTRCAAHTPVTLVECSPLMWQILCILRSVTTVNDFEVKSGIEPKHRLEVTKEINFQWYVRQILILQRHTHWHLENALSDFEVTEVMHFKWLKWHSLTCKSNPFFKWQKRLTWKSKWVGDPYYLKEPLCFSK